MKKEEHNTVDMGRAEDIFEKIIKDGESGINEFILSRTSEELFLDFKRSADNGSGSKLNDIDREHLAKAISGFGNSEGGVIVWGIDCSKDKDHADVAHTRCPIKNVQRFVSWLEGVVSGCTVPPHTNVRHHYITSGNEGEGFVGTLIPKSEHAPHQVVVRGKTHYRYYIRAGSNFEHTSHAVLAGMFGRRPQPHVFHTFVNTPPEVVGDQEIKVQTGYLIHNDGPGIARDLFMNLTVAERPGPNCELSIEPPDVDKWLSSLFLEMRASTISRPEIRLAPDAESFTFNLTFVLCAPFKDKLNIIGTCVCGQSPPYRFNIGSDSKTIERACNKFLEKWRKKTLVAQDNRDFMDHVFKVESSRKKI